MRFVEIPHRLELWPNYPYKAGTSSPLKLAFGVELDPSLIPKWYQILFYFCY
jgi:hypothetical protein